jgi:phenolic acid decarboxylase
MEWAEANFPNDIANIRYNARAKHYDVSRDKLPEYARYDILLFAFEKYCESITKNHENLIKQAGYRDNEEFQKEIEELENL